MSVNAGLSSALLTVFPNLSLIAILTRIDNTTKSRFKKSEFMRSIGALIACLLNIMTFNILVSY